MVVGPDHSPSSNVTAPRRWPSSGGAGAPRGAPELSRAPRSPGDDGNCCRLTSSRAGFFWSALAYSAAVFDEEKARVVNRHYLKKADPLRIAQLSVPYF